MAYYSGVLVPMVCVHIRGVSPIQGAGLEGFYCILTSASMAATCRKVVPHALV